MVEINNIATVDIATLDCFIVYTFIFPNLHIKKMNTYNIVLRFETKILIYF